MNDYRIISRNDLHSIIENFGNIGKFGLMDMHESFENLWNFFGFSENQEVMIIKVKFENFMGNYDSYNRSRKKEFLMS